MVPLVKKILVYPVKGLPGIELDEAFLLKEGLMNDRRLMLVDSENKFISQRNFPNLVDFAINLEKEKLKISFKGNNVEFAIDTFEETNFETRIWEHRVTANEVSYSVSDWFSEQLQHPVKLVRRAKGHKRIKKYSNKIGSTEVSFADAYPLLILGTASIEQLNAKLEKAVPFTRFRPNLLIETEVAHIEDNWNRISIGESQIEIIKPCARCQVVNVDQITGQKFKEPLKTLASYRKIENKIYFGANAACLQEGQVHIGDTLTHAE